MHPELPPQPHRRHRRFLTLAASAMALGLTLAACGSNGSESAENVPGVDTENKTITFGGWQMASGPTAIYAQNTRATRGFLDQVNENGGVNGWKLEWETPDAGADPSRALQVVKEQIDNKSIFAVLNGMGSAQNQAAFPYIQSTKTPYFAHASGNDGLTYTCDFVPEIVPFAPVSSWAGAILADYAVNELGKKRIFMVYSADGVGQPVQQTLSKYIPTIADYAGEASFAQTDTDFSGIGRKIADAKPDAVIWYGANPAAFVKTVKEAKSRGSEAVWLTDNVQASDQVMALDPGVTDGTYFFLPQRPFWDDSNPEIKNWKETMQKAQPKDPLGALSQSGWSVGYPLVEAVKRMTDGGEAPTREGFIKAFQSMGQVDDMGLSAGIRYESDNYYGQNKYWVAQWTKADQWTVDENARSVPEFDYCSTR